MKLVSNKIWILPGVRKSLTVLQGGHGKTVF